MRPETCEYFKAWHLEPEPKGFKKKWKKILKKQFADFAAVSTLHGMIYIGEEARHWIERYVDCKVEWALFFNKTST